MLRLLFIMMTLSVLYAHPGDELTPEQRRQLIEERNQQRKESNRQVAANRLGEAIAAAEKAAEIDRKVFGEASSERVDTLIGLASMHELRQDWPAARRVRKEILALQIKLYGERDWRTIDAKLAAAALETMSRMTREQLRQVSTLAQRSQQAEQLRAAGRYREAATVVGPLAREWEKLLAQVQ